MLKKDLIRHEFIGLEVEVIQAKNPSLIGIKGKIMSEDKSFKKLTAPMEITFLESPKNLVGFLTSF